MVVSAATNEWSEEDRSLIRDLHDHHKNLTKLLADYCGAGRLVKPKPALRHYVGRLLCEMDEMLAALKARWGE